LQAGRIGRNDYGTVERKATMTILHGDSLEMLKTIPSSTVDCCITSPPYYGLRDYGVDGQIGLEETPEEYVQKLVAVFQEVKRVLKDDGTLWVNIGDSYCGTGDKGDYKDPKYKDGRNGQVVSRTKNVSGLKHKDLIGIPWMLAFALREDGWYLRQDIIWHKPNPMPESVRDRCTKSHEYIFLLSKSRKYYYNYKAIQEPAKTTDFVIRDREAGQMNKVPGRSHMNGLKHNMYKVRNIRDVWSVPVRPFKGAHFATFPEELIKPCILAGSRENGIVLDPFFGSGTTGVVATKFNRDFIGIELNSDYIDIAKRRLESVQTESVFT
jgi:DNA modification methylase